MFGESRFRGDVTLRHYINFRLPTAPIVDARAFFNDIGSMTNPSDAKWSAEQQAAFWFYVLEREKQSIDLTTTQLAQFLDKEGFTSPHRKGTEHIRNRTRLMTKFKTQGRWNIEAIRDDLDRLRLEVENIEGIEERFQSHIRDAGNGLNHPQRDQSSRVDSRGGSRKHLNRRREMLVVGKGGTQMCRIYQEGGRTLRSTRPCLAVVPCISADTLSVSPATTANVANQRRVGYTFRHRSASKSVVLAATSFPEHR